MYINTLNSFLLHLQCKSMHIFDKIITTDSPKSHNPVKSIYFYKFCQWCCKVLPIMLALCSMLLLSYYAQNYAGIIGSSLCRRHHGFKRTLAKPTQKRLITKEITEKVVADANSHSSLANIHLATACLHT